jgi:hypothetical protein
VTQPLRRDAGCDKIGSLGDTRSAARRATSIAGEW